jgi:CO/xanthine dehydrogenase FAD-binding subunit
MKPARFSYFRARSAAEAVEMIRAAGEDARFLAGGQSLVPMMNFRIVRPSALVDLSACEDLAFVRHDGGKLRIGAMMRQRDAEEDQSIRQYCPLVEEALGHAGPTTIRNRATVGGSIANGYPVAQLPVVAVCLDAEMVLTGGNGERTVSAADFFIAGMVTAIEPTELLREIVFPGRGPRTRYAFAERGNHAGGAALAIVAACAELGADDLLERVSIAAAGLQSIPVRLKNVETALVKDGLHTSVHEAYRADLKNVDEAGEGGESDPQQRYLVRVLVEDVIAALTEKSRSAETVA